MAIEQTTESARDRLLLEHIENDPDVTQASLASNLGVAVGTVNWHIKRLIEKGYVKVKRAQRRKLRYLITPQGIALRARLTVEYVDRSMRLYRKTRMQVAEMLDDVRAAGYEGVRIETETESPDDITDICRLTCMEKGLTILNGDSSAPTLRVRGPKVQLIMDGHS
ncbi:MAG: winged helix-turn-helix transcriptional regulator [Chloroflexi bacterium]|nr:winged helix-turn-helix transcriptional regulator [Chloroflexota bacterium]